MSKKNNLKIVNRKISDLKPAEYNPRRIGNREKMELTKSIQKFKVVEPIVINVHPKRKDVVIGGHQRLRVMKSLGYKNVPCVELNLNPTDEKELNLRLNKNKGDFDLTKLADFDKDLLKQVGFLDREINKVFIDESTVKEEEFSNEILEKNNYIVFTFDNSVDWLAVADFFGLETVRAKDSTKDYKRKGVGRVVDGKNLLDLMK